MPGLVFDSSSTLTVKPIPYSDTVGDRVRDEQFGCIVEGIKDINNLNDDEFAA